VNPRHQANSGVSNDTEALETISSFGMGGSGMRIDPNLSPEMQAQVAAALASAQGLMGPPDTTPLADGLLGGDMLGLRVGLGLGHCQMDSQEAICCNTETVNLLHSTREL